MTRPATPTPITVTFAVEGMSCRSCVRHIDEALSEHFELVHQTIDLDADRVTVTFDPQTTSTEAIAKVLGAAGYPARAL